MTGVMNHVERRSNERLGLACFGLACLVPDDAGAFERFRGGAEASRDRRGVRDMVSDRPA